MIKFLAEDTVTDRESNASITSTIIACYANG